MNRRAPQRGQSMLAVMAVMLVVFGFAAALTTVGSAVLRAQAAGGGGPARDIAAQNAVAAALAQVAGSATACDEATALSLSLPEGASRASCRRIDGISPGAVTPLELDWSQGACGTAPLPGKGAKRWAVWFQAVSLSAAYVDGSASCSAPGSCAWSAGARLAGVYPVVVEGCKSEPGPLWLHVAGSGQPRIARYADVNSGQGSVYTVAASNPLGPPAYEEADLWVHATGHGNGGGNQPALVYEGTLG